MSNFDESDFAAAAADDDEDDFDLPGDIAAELEASMRLYN